VTVTSVHRGATQEPLELSRLPAIVTRDGVLPIGAAEAAAEAGGRVLLLGSGTAKAAAELGAPRAWQAETVGAAPAGVSAALVPLLPYFFLPVRSALWVSVGLSAVVMFGVGVWKSRLTKRNPLVSGLEILVLVAGAAIAGSFFGSILPGLLGVAGIR